MQIQGRGAAVGHGTCVNHYLQYCADLRCTSLTSMPGLCGGGRVLQVQYDVPQEQQCMAVTACRGGAGHDGHDARGRGGLDTRRGGWPA